MTKITDTVLSVDNPNSIDREEIWKGLERDTVVAIRGLIDPDQVKASLEKLKSGFSIENDKKRAPGDYEAVKSNYQRMCIGMTGGIKGPANPRYFRVFYNPLWEEDLYGMHSVFMQMAKVRNYLMGVPESFATSAPERGLWTASRIQHYPAGGGFLIPHRDLNAHKAMHDAGFERSVNLVLLMTKRGIDFEEGGGFVEINGSRVYYEDEYEVGDLVLYDEQNIHGVEDIDPMKPMDSSTTNGRYTAFATLFRE